MVVPWIPLVAIDVEVDVTCIHPPCNLDFNVWDPSNWEMDWDLSIAIAACSCLPFLVDGLLSSTGWTEVPKDGHLPQAIVFNLSFWSEVAE